MHERISWMEGKGWINIVILLHDIKFKAWEGRETQEVTVFDQWDVVCTYIRDTAWQKSSDVVYWAKDESNTCSDSMMRSALQLDFCFASPPFAYTLFCNNTNPTVYLTAFPIFFFRIVTTNVMSTNLINSKTTYTAGMIPWTIKWIPYRPSYSTTCREKPQPTM